MAGAGRAEPCQRRIDTSISWVFLYPEFALKLKRPVDFGFVDFTTLEKRRWAAERELEFNRPSAPDIYRAVRSVVRTAEGDFALGGEGEVIDWALEMRRFDETAVLSERPELVVGDFAEALGRRIAQMHARAPPGSKGGGAQGLRDVAVSNARQLRQLGEDLDAAQVERLLTATDKAIEAHAGLLDARLRAGFVRRCHGDLHLGNILVENGRATPFDCIEFNDALSEIDVLYDLAFLLMDLGFRGKEDGASRALNGWLDEAARSFGPDLWGGLAVLPLFQAIRAAVRAHVCGHAGDAAAARRYLDLAEGLLEPARPMLLAVGGLSGSGKSTLARVLAPLLRPFPGAVVLRSDEIRKRLWGKGPRDPLPRRAYTERASREVYAAMLRVAELCLRADWPVVLDAVFLRADQRQAAENLAGGLQLSFAGTWLEAPAEVLERRLAGRSGDASDADARVLRGQLRQDPGPIGWTREGAAEPQALARALSGRVA
jgi:hypothetical protein